MKGERIFKDGTIKRLSQFNNLSTEVILAKIDVLHEEGLEKAEIFRRLSEGKGTPDTHYSGLDEGDILKPFLSRKKPKRRMYQYR